MHHKDNGIHLTLPYAQMNREARIWRKISYHCLIQGKHITDVMHDKVCLIYSLIRDEIDINVGVVIFSVMKKARYH